MSNFPTEKQLLEKWGKILDFQNLPKIKDHYRRVATAIMLENQERNPSEEGLTMRSLMEAAPANQSGAFPNATYLKGYDPVLISLVRRAAPNLIAFDVCGVQPMTGPTGLIFALRSKYSTQGGTEALFDEADTDHAGAGGKAGTTPVGQSDLNSYKPGIGFTTANAEALGDGAGADIAEMAFSLDKVTATALSRKLRAKYTMEIQQDLKAVHGLDAEAELANILATEILAEINREVIRRIYHDAKPGAQYNVTTPGTFDMDVDSNGRWLEEKIKGLMFRIDMDANAIAKDTRRGRGNLLITSSDVASALSIAGLIDSSGLKESLNYDGDTANTFVGTLNNRYKVYVDPYVAQAALNYYVVGYRGTSQFDAGLFYCPYVPLQLVRAVDPRSYQPSIAFQTRYAVVSNPFANSAGDGSLVWQANRYYRLTTVSNLQ